MTSTLGLRKQLHRKFITKNCRLKRVSMQLPGLVAVVTICSLLLITEASFSSNDSLLRLLVKILQQDVDVQRIEKVSDDFYPNK